MGNGFTTIEWDDAFLTGVEEIDQQHKILVNILNDAISRVQTENSRELLLQITRELLAYALYHFETEETLMLNYQFQDVEQVQMAEHIQQHRDFTQQVLAVRDELSAGIEVDAIELLDFLYQWLFNHIMKTDKALANEILARRKNAEN